jgi:hypothetical protein
MRQMNELRPWIGEPPHTVAPVLSGYQQISHESLEIGKLTLLGLLLIPAWAIGFTALLAILGGRREFEITFNVWEFLWMAGLLVAVIVVHELLHGVVAALFGAKPSFGVGPGFAYTTFLESMSKVAYLAIGVAPLIIISVVSVAGALIWPAAAGWLLLVAIINAGGAVGDLWMAARIVRSPSDARFYDLADGFAIYVPQQCR